MKQLFKIAALAALAVVSVGTAAYAGKTEKCLEKAAKQYCPDCEVHVVLDSLTSVVRLYDMKFLNKDSVSSFNLDYKIYTNNLQYDRGAFSTTGPIPYEALRPREKTAMDALCKCLEEAKP